MESARVDICYRPLRIGWAIRTGDITAFRSAARFSFALWGGRFNPIIEVDDAEHARKLVNLFRVDTIVPVGDSELVKAFPSKFPYLPQPFFGRHVFEGNSKHGAWSNVLDVKNALWWLQGDPEWVTKRQKFRLHSWEVDDPLADIFLMQLGAYPSDIAIPYRKLFEEATAAEEIKIALGAKLPKDLFEYATIQFLSRYNIDRHYSVQPEWDTPGFYSGDVENLEDLINCWNLRAADIPLLFVDAKHLDRYGETIIEWGQEIRKRSLRRREESEGTVGVWLRQERVDGIRGTDMTEKILKPFGKRPLSLMRVGRDSFPVRPPTMCLGQTSTLGVMGTELNKPKVSFALDDKPFSSDLHFNSQQLVASVSFMGGLHGDEQHVLVPPFIPELNEFYGREQHFEPYKVRSEPDRIGLVMDVADSSTFVYALPVADFFEKVFKLAGFSSNLSEAGLILRQLITQLGGADGARAFKIPGVRRLLKTYAPGTPFTKNSALQLIGAKDPENPSASFKDYEHLYIEPRPNGVDLTPEGVFTYLVAKGLFRIGAELKCPHCRLSSWIPLDSVAQRLTCELCGEEFDATRQLVHDAWRFRRSGVLGRERNAQGAIPVALLLQQLKVNMHHLSGGIYSPSLELSPLAGTDLPRCEIDFAWLIPRHFPMRNALIIGECKDRGGNSEKGAIGKKDIDNLRGIADSLPRDRFDTFILLAKLCPFTIEELALAKTLNETYRRRVILLTNRELEPYFLLERTKREHEGIDGYHAGSPEDLARVTAQIYFKS